MARRWTPERKKKAWIKTAFSSYYVLFLLFIYGPMFAMFILSFQGRRGGTSFPMRGSSICRSRPTTTGRRSNGRVA